MVPHNDDDQNNQDNGPTEPRREGEDLQARAHEALEDAQEAVSSTATKIWNSTPVRLARVFAFMAGVTPAFRMAKWSLKRQSTTGKGLGLLFTAAATGAYMGALAYGGALGYVKFNDSNALFNWPATQGQWTGNITRFSKKGSLMCQSYEGNLRTGEAADSEFFAVRQWDTDLIEAIQNIPNNADVTLVYRDNGLTQERFENNGLLHCIQHSDHTAVGLHYTANGQTVSVGITPN